MGDGPEVDIVVVGAGVLGVTLAYWLRALYDCRIVLADLSDRAAAHTSSRNTGVIHRPFYLDPVKKQVFARTSLVSYQLWRSLAEAAGLPWKPVGTYNVALDERDFRTVEAYRSWGVQNGMEEAELQLLDERGVKAREPEVSCKGALLSKADVSVDFGAFTRQIMRRLLSGGVGFLSGHRLASVSKRGDETTAVFRSRTGLSPVRTRFLVNAAGGGALGIARAFGFGRRYATLHFRGEYWVVDEPFASKVTSNIYRPPRFPQYPFLDPHFVVRADGTRQIGPNAVVVPGPYVYSGVGLSRLPSFLDPPVEPKARLFADRDFVSLVAAEWRSSLSKGAMCGRVKKFVPGLGTAMLNRRAVFGVRSSVIDGSGFVPEAVLFKGEDSVHIINYNSPGATGAPAYSAKVVDGLWREGYLDWLKPRAEARGIPGWAFEQVAAGA